jgi:hypothetical protein
LINSIYACGTQNDISLLVKDQPNPTLFFKVFLELGRKSVLQYIAFDYRSMNILLDSKNEQYFSSKFPLFYKNEDGNSAIDVALDKNLIRSVNMFNNYICKY